MHKNIILIAELNVVMLRQLALTSDICGLVGKLKDCLVLSIATGKHGAP
jgi:hypothetical protein